MLPRSKRLNLKRDFKWVGSGKKIDAKYATFFIRIGDNPYPRLGIAVSSKLLTKSTQRHRAKRILSKAFESVYSKLPQNINIVALPKFNILDVKSNDVVLDLEEILKDEKIID